CSLVGQCIAKHAVGATVWIMLLAAATSMPAATTDWNTNLSGNFDDAANWDNGTPTGFDTAVFRRGVGITYTVTFRGLPLGAGTANYPSDQLRVGSNTVTLAGTSPATSGP